MVCRQPWQWTAPMRISKYEFSLPHPKEQAALSNFECSLSAAEANAQVRMKVDRQFVRPAGRFLSEMYIRVMSAISQIIPGAEQKLDNIDMGRPFGVRPAILPQPLLG